MKRIIVTTLALTLLVSLAITGTGCKLTDCFFMCANPSIDIEVQVSVDHGENWIDADSLATAPDIVVGEWVKYKYIVTNTGDVELTNITIIDPLYDDSGEFAANVMSMIIDPLLPGASFEGKIGWWYPNLLALEGLHTITATATGDYIGVTYLDSDDACYIGISSP